MTTHQLRSQAKHYQKTMADMFRLLSFGKVLLDVPAKITKETQSLIYFEFEDGSVDKYPAERVLK